jgi:dTDP-4-amino-4,6-dideoxygalactose transaminase
MFYLECPTAEFRTNLIKKLRDNGIHSVFHYLSLHKSDFYRDKHDGRDLPEADRYSECLVRLPVYYGVEARITSENIV